LRHYIALVWRVIDQTERRVLRAETVPVADKLFSLFEPHSDLIIKGGRGPEFGHKLFLAGGKSGMVTDVRDLDGNPADTTLVEDWLDRHVEQYGEPPDRTAFDGGFASQANLALLKEAGVRDAVFHKKRGLEIADMARSTWIYRTTRKFRAGIESTISFLKRCFGWTRCGWRGLDSFRAYVRAAVVTANLFVFARHRLAEAED
jgi:IS5 family transposase